MWTPVLKYMDVCEPASQQFTKGHVKATLRTPQRRWLTVWSRKRDGTLHSEPSKRGKKAEPQDPPAAGPFAVGAPAPVLYPPVATLPYAWPGAPGPWAPSPWNVYPPTPIGAGTAPPPPPPSVGGAVTRVVCPPGPPAYPDSSTATQDDIPGRLQGRAPLGAP